MVDRGLITSRRPDDIPAFNLMVMAHCECMQAIMASSGGMKAQAEPPGGRRP